MTKLIVGCGYLGKRVAAKWRDAGVPVVGITRSSWYPPNRNLHTFNADVLDPTSLADLKALSLDRGWQIDTVLYSVGKVGALDIRESYAIGLKNVLANTSSSTTRIIYISTTGVYGPGGGEWVDETTPPDPRREGGRASLAAEHVLTEHAMGKRSVILRLAGIYGPGRVPFIRELREGKPIPVPASGWLNLIHVDDAASVVIAADELPSFSNGPRIYCVSDGNPVERGEYYSEVARQISASPPQFVEPAPHSPRAARAEANRRISNARMLADLRVTLTYPDYRAGLAAVLSK